jgi:CBS domain-containing protein
MKEKKVRDLMLSLDEYATVRSDSTIKEALEVLSIAQLGLDHRRYLHRAVLVLDERSNVIGKLSHWAILWSLEPKYLNYYDEASLARAGLTEDFIKSIRENFSLFAGGLEQQCHATARIKAKDAMVPIGESIAESAPLTEAIHLMVTKHVMSIPVTRRGKVVGILRQSDVFEEVAELIRASNTSS